LPLADVQSVGSSLIRSLGRFKLVCGVLAAFFACAQPGLAAERGRPLPALVPAPNDGLTRALERGALTEAEYALERARSVFQLARAQAKWGRVERVGGREVTLVLRDLAVRLRLLEGEERTLAERILARPDRGGVPIGNGWTAPPANRRRLCGTDICFHWVVSTADRPQPPSMPDDDGDGFPNWVELMQAEFENVWAQHSALGYRPPRSDVDSRPSNGGDARLDIYVDDLGVSGVFGYCTSDDPRLSNPSVFAVSAYCVVDNDYSAAQFGTRNTPGEFLRVTAAHEFHHASQFAYDWLEDLWLLEGTATNMEETIYPGVDDNLFFLRLYSPLTRPASPLDRGGFFDSEYGSWIFWRYLQEKTYAGDPTALRRIWERADASTALAPDDHSVQAVARVLAADRRNLAAQFTRFGVANRLRDYADGRLYPRPRAQHTFGMSRRRPSSRWRNSRIDHLATRFFSFVPVRRLPEGTRLKVSVDAPARGRATVIVFPRAGTARVRPLLLNRRGRGFIHTAFRQQAVTRVELVLTNSSRRFRCWTRPPFDAPIYSCLGTPLDDRRRFRFRGVLRR
jgi:hypothetical protein